jgi:type IV pilus assembly protein PilW
MAATRCCFGSRDGRRMRCASQRPVERRALVELPGQQAVNVQQPSAPGFTLVELLVALALSLLLVGASLQAYLAAKRALLWQAASSRLDADGHWALALISRDLRMAGYFAGAALPAAAPDGRPHCSDGDSWPLRPAALELWSAAMLRAGTPRLDCLPLADLQEGSDIAALRRVDGAATWGPYSDRDRRGADRTQWYLAVGPAGEARLHWQGEGVPVPPAENPGFSYWAYRARIYYVRSYSSMRDDGIPTLCVERLLGRGMRSECLVEGVEKFRVEVLVDGDGDGTPERLLGPGSAFDPSEITHVQLHFLMRSVHAPGVSKRPTQLRLGAERVTVAPDGHLRRVYSATVALRNRRRNHAPLG